LELYATLCALYLLQCAARLPQGACLFVPTLFGVWVSPGPGFRLLHPLPTGKSYLGRRFPLAEEAGSLRGRVHAGSVERADLSGATAHESAIRVAGRTFARCAGPADAEHLAGVLRSLAESEPPPGRACAETAIASGLSMAHFEDALARFGAGTRWLAWTGNAYSLSLFVLLPVASWSVGTEYSLALFAPVLLALHVATLWSFARAHARLFPARRAERLQSLFGVALYPPGLLRAHQQLRDDALGSIHPAVLAAAVLPQQERGAFLRAELARAAFRSRDESGTPLGFSLAALEERGLRRLIAEVGQSAEALLAEPVRRDPWALAYCPACVCEYRRDGGDCVDCGVPLARLRAGPLSDPARSDRSP
jgi:hypothetical protein